MDLNFFLVICIVFLIHRSNASTKQRTQRSEHVAEIPTRHTSSEHHHHVPIPVPQPVPVHIPRPIPVPIAIPVPVDHPRPVHYPVPHPVPYFVSRPVAVPVNRPFPYPVPQPVPVVVTQHVGIPVPKPYHVPVPAPVAVKVPYAAPVGHSPQLHYGFQPIIHGSYGYGSHHINHHTAHDHFGKYFDQTNTIETHGHEVLHSHHR